MSDEILFEKFKIISIVKKDDLRAVYLADHIFLRKKIFLKTLNTKFIPEPSALRYFKREARALANLDHANIIKVYDFGSYRQFFYISFEYFESRNLRQLLNQRKLNEQERIFILTQLCQGLIYAHEKGVIHRDLKPENILIGENLRVKIADFGLAVVKGEASITEEASIVGTPAYMSPEQLRGEDLSLHSDLFSLGIIAFELYAGRNLFLGADAGRTINNILNMKQADIEAALEPLPEYLRKMLNGLLQKDAAKRFPSLRQALEYLPGGKQPPAASALPARVNKKRMLIFFLITALVFVTVLFYPRSTGQNDQPTGLLPDTVSVVKTAAEPLKDSTQTVGKQTQLQKKSETVRRDIPAAKRQKQRFKEPATGKLWIECLPWANAAVDSGVSETTPLSRPFTLTAGRHRIRLQHPAYPEFTTTVYIDSGQTVFFRINLDTLMGYLQCRIIPWGNIYLNGNYLGQSPFQQPFKLKPGRYRLSVRNDRFPSHDQEIVITRKDTLRIKVDFFNKE